MQCWSWTPGTIVAGRAGTVTRRGALLGLLCSLVMAATALPTRADPPRRVFIDIHDFAISDDTAVGTFESSGAIETSGLESQVFRTAGQSLHCVHTLKSNSEKPGLLYRAANQRLAIAMPTLLPQPWPSGPVVVSTPVVW